MKRSLAAASLLIGLAACGGGGDGGPDPTPPPGQTLLSSTGLYTNIASQQIDTRNRFFAPQYVLWSDNGDKRRWIFLPPQTQIDRT